MKTEERTKIRVAADIAAPVEKVWQFWTGPEHIVKWNSASDDWHTPRATNDLRTGGKFTSRMEAKDGSMGFDFEGVYDEVRNNEYTEYTMPDGRNVKNTFTANGDRTNVEVVFDAENQNPVEMQRDGWQAILNNFKKYAEEQA